MKQAWYVKQRPDWYVWIIKRQRGIHDHHALRANGKPAACPVRGCEEGGLGLERVA